MKGIHLVDTTMFWSPSGGGVRRYLETKHAWLAHQAGWRHTVAVPTLETLASASASAAATVISASVSASTASASAAASAVALAAASTSVSASASAPASASNLAFTAATTLHPVALPALPLPGSSGYRLPLQRAAIADRLAALEPDLIEAGDPYCIAWSAIDAAHRRGIPAIAFCHSNLAALARLVAGPQLGRQAERAARVYLRTVYEHFDAVLAPSRAMCRALRDWGIARVACQPLGVDGTVFHPARRSAAWRDAMGYAPDTRLLVYAGRFAPEKHLDVLAAAVERLGPPYALLAIGAGPSRPRGARVLPFVRGADQLATALASADAFVHAGDQETFGLAALEAMACGTPLVARASAGLAELVDEQVGMGVPHGDAASFAEAIAALFEPTRDRAALGRAARTRAEHYDWAHVFPALLARYRELLRHAAVPAQAATDVARSVP